MESPIFVYLIIVALFLFALWTLFREENFVIEKDCDCHKNYDKCISKNHITTSSRGIRMKRDVNEMFQCGKVQDQLEEANKMWEKINKNNEGVDDNTKTLNK